MKKIYSLILAMFAMISISAQSAGIFESYAVLKVGIGGEDKYFDLKASTDANPDFNGANLGTFYTASSLVVSGGQNKTFKCNGGDITGGTTYYRVYPAGTNPGSLAFTTIPMTFKSDDAGAGANCQNQTWEGLSGTENLIAGRDPGNYTLEIYTSAGTNLGNPPIILADNNGSYYKANFTVTNVLSVADFGGPTKKSVVVDGKLITSQKGNLNITVYDFSGKIVKTIKANGNGNAIDVILPKKGLYLMSISNGNEKEVVKFSY